MRLKLKYQIIAALNYISIIHSELEDVQCGIRLLGIKMIFIIF